nr:thioredoxin family protein [uncultured Marinifilum sp.]
MKNIFLLLVATLLSCNLFAQGIEFEHGTFNEALAKAKKENKLVFMDCYTSWCGPCKHLAKTVFTQKEVGDYFNANFVCVKMDMEKGEGIELCKKYGVKAFPTLLFIDTKGEVVHKVVGGKPAGDLIEDAKAATNPELNMNALTEKYKNGNRDYDFMITLLKALNNEGNDLMAGVVSKELLAKYPIEKFLNKELFQVVNSGNLSFESDDFKKVLGKQDQLKKELGEQAFGQFVGGVVWKHLSAYAQICKSIEDLKNEIAKCEQTKAWQSNEYVEKELNSTYYLSSNQYQKWFDYNITALGPKTESKYIYGLLDLGDKIYYNQKLREQKEIVEQAFTLAKELADTEQGLIIGNFMLSKMYVIKKEKEKALKCFNLFYDTNKKTRGELTHPTITDIRDAIKAL